MEVISVASTGKGINAELIPAAQEAIQTYKTNMSNRLNEFKSEIDFSTAFIGENQSVAISNYYGRVMDSIAETFAYLDSFSTAINQAKEQYMAEEQKIAETLNQVGSSNAPTGDALDPGFHESTLE